MYAHPFLLRTESYSLERPFLGEGVSGKCRALRAFRYLHAYGRSFGSSDACRTQHRVLREDFVVDLGDEVVLTVGITAPHLPELDGIDCHGIRPDLEYTQTTEGGSGRQFPGRLLRDMSGDADFRLPSANWKSARVDCYDGRSLQQKRNRHASWSCSPPAGPNRAPGQSSCGDGRH